MEEKELIRKAQRNEDVEECFRTIVSRYKNPLISFMYRYTLDIKTAEDLSQEAFIRVFRNISKLDADRNFSTWLFTIAYNLVKDEYKRRTRHPEVPSEFDAVSDLERPESDFESKDMKDMVQQALATMPNDERALLILKDMNGLHYDEISFITGQPLSTVKAKLTRARLKFKDIWTNLKVKP